jgi:hypothetical protein
VISQILDAPTPWTAIAIYPGCGWDADFAVLLRILPSYVVDLLCFQYRLGDS